MDSNLLKEVYDMPFKSEKQRRFMFANHPEIAKRWTREGKDYVEAAKRRLAKTSKKPRRKS